MLLFLFVYKNIICMISKVPYVSYDVKMFHIYIYIYRPIYNSCSYMHLLSWLDKLIGLYTCMFNIQFYNTK